MTAIAIGGAFISCICSAVGGGGYLYVEEQKRQERIKHALKEQGVTWFEECNFKGGIVMENIFEPPIDPEGIMSLGSVGDAKSFIVGPNVKLVFYRDEERTDAVETITVPKKFPCDIPSYKKIVITPII
tara:strand:- start:2675 stop:3061 length:387 start_codon:yes stop_codon:yes gene_type:complete